jgi:hypothetical protein
MPQDQVKVKPEEVKVTSTPPATEPVKKKGISPWIIVLIVVLILVPCILCFIFMVLPLILATTNGVTKYTTTSSSTTLLDDYYPATSSADSLMSTSSSSVTSSDITYDGTTSIGSSSSSRSSGTTSVASTSSSSVASTTTSSSSSSVPFAVTGITISANPTTPDHSLQCGELYTFPFTGSITANGAGTFSYYWYRQDTGRYPVQTITFTSAGTKQITKDVTVKANEVSESPHFYSGYFQVQVFENVEPAVLKSNVVSINYNVACVP